MKDTYIQSGKTKESNWFIVDATQRRLGRLSTEIVKILRGKNQITFMPSFDSKNYVIIVNAEKIEVTGKKRWQKLYYNHSGRPGGLKVQTFNNLQEKFPTKILELAIKRMLPKGKLGSTLFKRLRVYEGIDYPEKSQKPILINL